MVPPRPGLCSVYAADVGSAAFSVNWACQWSCSSSVYDLPPRGRMPLRPGSALDTDAECSSADINRLRSHLGYQLS